MEKVWAVYTDENQMVGLFANKKSADAYVKQEMERDPRGDLFPVETVVNDWSKYL